MSENDGPRVPDDVNVTLQPREPVTDPTLGIAVTVERRGDPRHRLVSIGDSLTHGFMSGAVYQTGLSYSAIVAHELGWSGLRYPRYPGHGGLPLNLELLLRELAGEFGADLNWWELPLALFRARSFMDTVEDYWERGPGAHPPPASATNHVLGVFGWDLRDALVRTYASCEAEIGRPSDDTFGQLVQHAEARAALRVLPAATDADRKRTVFEAAAALGQEVGEPPDDPENGIETLVVFLGANNALGAVTGLKVTWSADGFDDVARTREFTVWRPSHFRAELDEVAAQVRRIAARHVIWCTVPHVTIAPIARGIGGKMAPGSRYFPFYTRPWIDAARFDPGRDPAITGAEARAVDSAIDQYNDAITDVVRQARNAGRDWYLLDVAGVLDRLASRRYLEDPQARPAWWTPYPLPPEVAALNPVLGSQFLTVDENGGRRSGGLFSLDGVHPTTVGYGIIAQELISVMTRAGVQFRSPNGAARRDPVQVDFARLIRLDTLVTRPPSNLTSGLQVLGWADEALDVLRRVLT